MARRRTSTCAAAWLIAWPGHAPAAALDAEAAPPAPGVAACDADCLNQRAMADWARQSGIEAPVLERGAEGEVRLQWHGTFALKSQPQRVDAGAPGAVNTPRQSGQPVMATLRSEWQLPELDGDSVTLNLAALAGNDLAVLPRHASQVQNLAAAWQGGPARLQLGDHAVSFSQLGLQLGYRGMYLQHEWHGLELALLGGTVAESWESLFNRAPRGGAAARSQYLRDVAAVQAGRGFDGGLRLTAATGAWRDRIGSLDATQRSTAGAQGHLLTWGAQWQQEALSLALEFAHSRTSSLRGITEATDFDAVATTSVESGSAQSELAAHSASAASFDVAWRFDVGQLRAGLRRIGQHFGSMAATAPAGSEEMYLAGDGTLGIVQLNADLRRTTQRSDATAFAAASRSVGERLQLGANVSLATWLEGLSSAWQASVSDQRDGFGARNRQAQVNGGLQWQTRLAMLSLQAGENRSRTPGYALADSNSRSLQAQVALPFGAAADSSPPTLAAAWSGQASVGLSLQEQTLTALAAVARTQGVSLGLQAQHDRLGLLNLALQEQASRAPQGGARLRQRLLQADLQRTVGEATDARLGLRWAWRNLGDAELLARERSVSLEVQTRW